MERSFDHSAHLHEPNSDTKFALLGLTVVDGHGRVLNVKEIDRGLGLLRGLGFIAAESAIVLQDKVPLSPGSDVLALLIQPPFFYHADASISPCLPWHLETHVRCQAQIDTIEQTRATETLNLAKTTSSSSSLSHSRC
eukprot:m.434013 g.434013  ORF g.434013 m.434013 type:complete len:138 (+) comp17654_c0_seq1:1332-1745(+)